MINTLVMQTIVGNYLQPGTGLTVQVYAYHASDVAGSAPNGALIGAASELGLTGLYTISLSESQKVTIVSGGLAVAGMINRLLHGESALDDSVDTSAVLDAAVTNAKTSFAGDF